MAPLWLTIGSLSWGRPGGSWWSCHLGSGFECHTYHRSSWCFHKDLVCIIWQYDLIVYFIGDRLGCCSALVINPIIDLTGRPVESFLHLVHGHLGYLHLVRAFLRWSFSCWSSSGLLHTVVALWERVWMTLNLAERWWWLSHCKYWSVCVGFLYTMIDNVPSASGLTMVSKKGMDPSSLLSPTVNFTTGSTLFMCWRKPCLLTSLQMTKVSSTNLCQNLGELEQCLELFVLSTPCRG